MIVGRDGEQAVLDRVIEAARHGAGGCVILRGEPGIGKTALLDELVKQTDGIVLYSCGHEWEADLPYAALGDLLRPVLGELDHVPAPQARALRNALGIEASAGLDPVAVEVATATLLRVAAERAPLLVVVDDIAWIDTASRDVLLYVARRASNLGIAVIGAAREEEITAALSALPALPLGPLASAAAAALLRERASDTLLAPVSDALVELGNGNPLALQELFDGLSPQQLSGQAPILEPIAVSTEAVLAFRRKVDDLPDATRQALLVAASEGRGRVDRVLAALARLGSDGNAFEAAEQAGLISISGDAVQFRHPVVRSVAYQTATPAARRAAHAALASVEPEPDRRAWHMSASVAHPDRDVSDALVDVARRALARGADTTAALALSRAAELALDGATRGGLYGKAARAANRGGDVPMATRLLELARPLVADDVIGRADLVLLDADLRMRRGEVDRAYRALAAEAEAIAPIDPRRAKTMLLFAAKAHVYKMEGTQALRAVERALDLADDGTPDMLQVTSLAMTRTMSGHPDAARTALDAAREGVANPRGHLHTLGIAWPLIWLEEFDAAQRFITWAVQVQREGGYHSFLPQSLLPEAELDFRTGHWDRALAGALEAAQLFAETNQPIDVAIAASTLARIEAARGHAAATAEHAEAAFSGDRSSGALAATAFGESALGHLELSRRQFDRAVDHLSRAAGIVTRGEVPEVGLLQMEPDLIEALVRTGRVDAAAAVAESLTELATRTGRPWQLAVAARCRGMLASAHSSARTFVDEFLEALDHHSRTPTPFALARTHLCFAERLLESGADHDAAHHLALAAEQFTALGARLWTDWARARLRSVTGERPTSQHGLTPREEQVAQLVASGASNKDVASILYVNAKTVEYHLANVYRKLGIRTRTDLALFWQDSARADPRVG